MSLSIESLWKSAKQSLVLLFEGQSHQEKELQCLLNDSVTCVLTGLPYPDLNMAIVSGTKDPNTTLETQAALDKIVQSCKLRNLPCLLLSDGVDALCESQGLTNVGNFPLMVIDQSSIHPYEEILDDTSIELSLAISDDDVSQANQTVSLAFGLPSQAIDSAFGSQLPTHSGLRVYVAKRSGRVVCSLRVSQVDTTSGLWCMATEPQLQRQGIGKQLLSFAMANEVILGAEQLLLLATPDGLPLYQQVGFKTVAQATAFLISSDSNEHITHPSPC